MTDPHHPQDPKDKPAPDPDPGEEARRRKEAALAAASEANAEWVPREREMDLREREMTLKERAVRLRMEVAATIYAMLITGAGMLIDPLLLPTGAVGGGLAYLVYRWRSSRPG